MRTRVAVDIQLNWKAERSNQAAFVPDHGGDAVGSGRGVRAGIICSLALLMGVGRVSGGGGKFNAGCLTLLVGDGVGGIRSTGAFAE